MGNENSSKTKRVLINLSVFVLIVALIFVIIKYSSGIGDFWGRLKSDKNAFRQYEVSYTAKGNTYHVLLKDIVNSTGKMAQETYVRADIILDVETKETAEMIVNKNKHAVAVISRVISTMNADILHTQEGKNYLKRQVKEELQKLYGVDDIRNVYLSSFVFK